MRKFFSNIFFDLVILTVIFLAIYVASQQILRISANDPQIQMAEDTVAALATGKAIYVCGFTATVGASSTIQFEYGTGSACGTGTTALTGVFTPATAALLSLTGEGTKITAPASNALCAVSTGTGGINGVLTYSAQ